VIGSTLLSASHELVIKLNWDWWGSCLFGFG
jgi:hypothetical protein